MYVDALLQIIVPRISPLEGLTITQPVYEWDGVKYPQGPEIVQWQNISLSVDQADPYGGRYLPPDYVGSDWIWLKVSDETLSEYEEIVNTDPESEASLTFEHFLRLILEGVDKWVIAFLLQYDQIDETYRQDIDACIATLRNNLDRENETRVGFVSYR